MASGLVSEPLSQLLYFSEEAQTDGIVVTASIFQFLREYRLVVLGSGGESRENSRISLEEYNRSGADKRGHRIRFVSGH